MKAVVRKSGVLVPKRMLGAAKEVEIRKQGNAVVVQPLSPENDPVFELGTAPVHTGVRDGAAHHDSHLYGGS